MDIITQTRDGNTVVEVEYVKADIQRNTGGAISSFTGKLAASNHDSKAHGTFVMEDTSGNYHTVHINLLMKLNGEFVN